MRAEDRHLCARIFIAELFVITEKKGNNLRQTQEMDKQIMPLLSGHLKVCFKEI